MSYRFAFDLGSSSVGWCVYRIDENKRPVQMVKSGVRVFPDSMEAKQDVPKNVRRREKRSQRRNSDRYKARRENLMNALIKYGFMPDAEKDRKQLEILDPYEIRKKALDMQVSGYELGRALFHINQRRGFKSNRKTDSVDSESGVMKKSISAFKQEMEKSGRRTAGEMLYMRRKQGYTVLAKRAGAKTTDLYEVYIDRELVRDEIKTLWEIQSRFAPEKFSSEAYEIVSSIILDQRPLEPPVIGKCSCEPDNPRASKALPIAQRFRLLQLITDMKLKFQDFTTRPLTQKERDKLFILLVTSGSVNFNTIRKKLGFDSSISFSHEHMEKIIGDETAAKLRSPSGKLWDKFSVEQQTEIVKLLLNSESDSNVISVLEEKFDLPHENAVKMAGASLPIGRAAFCEEVLEKLCKQMEKGECLSDALDNEGYGDRNPRLDGSMDYLPYYGEVLKNHILPGRNDDKDHYESRIGKIPNPVVHVGLNQLQKVANALIKEYGKPEEIVVELARELKLNREAKKKIKKQQDENRKRNEELIDKYLKPAGIQPSRVYLDKLKLWEELSENVLERCCAYCGGTLSMNQILSAETETEHILPFKRTLDNSMANKTVSHRKCNRDKGDRSPYEAFGKTDKWLHILAIADRMPHNKKWRFQPDAMERYEGERDFIARQLSDSQYFTKMAQQYLTAVCSNVWSVPGSLTALVRNWTGLTGLTDKDGKKNRGNHRHHAVDAMAIGLIDRSMLQKVSTLSGRNADEYLRSEKLEYKPWKSFFEDAKESFDQIIVSYKPEHRKTGQFFGETAYGIKADENGKEYLVTKKVLNDIEKEKDISSIIDNKIRTDVESIFDTYNTKDERSKALKEYSDTNNIKSVRCKEVNESVFKIKDKTGKAYKAYAYGDKHHVDVYEKPDGKISYEPAYFCDVCNPSYMPEWKKDKNNKLLLRLHKRDIVQLSGDSRLFRVIAINSSSNNANFIVVASDAAGKQSDLKKNKDSYLTIQYSLVKKRGVQKLYVDELGRVTPLRY